MQGINVTLEELLGLRHIANQLQISQRKVSNNAQQGNYTSTLRGRGMDFVETRIYQPGDDVRSINWAVTARSGKPHTKIYQQERERPVFLILDFSSSMFFGTKVSFKSVTLSRVASLIGWAALKNGDRIGAILIKDKIQVLQPKHNKQGLLLLLKSIVDFARPNIHCNADTENALKKLRQIIKSGSLIYYLSDFYNLSQAVKNELQYLAKYNEVVNVFIYDPLEKNPPRASRYLFHDPRHQESILLDTRNNELCAKYSEIFQQRLQNLKKICFASGMHLVELATDADIVAIFARSTELEGKLK